MKLLSFFWIFAMLGNAPVFAEEFNFFVEEDAAADKPVTINDPKFDEYYFLANTAEEIKYTSYSGYASYVARESEEMKTKRNEAVKAAQKALAGRGTQACNYYGYTYLFGATTDSSNYSSRTFAECVQTTDGNCVWLAQNQGSDYVSYTKSDYIKKDFEIILEPTYFRRIKCSNGSGKQ